jgi:hypothetical protein
MRFYKYLRGLEEDDCGCSDVSTTTKDIAINDAAPGNAIKRKKKKKKKAAANLTSPLKKRESSVQYNPMMQKRVDFQKYIGTR